MRIVVVAGMLAAGKSVALKFFQDMSYYCVDNLPPKLIDTFLNLVEDSQIDNVAIVLDARSIAFFEDIGSILDKLKKEMNAEILYVDADDETLIARYKFNRRKHLISTDDRIDVAIQKERKSMFEIKKRADFVVDTSKLKEKDFEKILIDRYGNSKEDKFVVNVSSFGFKYGIIRDADIVFDVRFLPNPFYIDELKPLSGIDKPVRDYVFKFEQTVSFVKKLEDLLAFTIPYYIKEGKAQLVIGIACTGGRHRSVAIAEEIYKKLTDLGYNVVKEHRDINKDVNKVYGQM